MPRTEHHGGIRIMDICVRTSSKELGPLYQGPSVSHILTEKQMGYIYTYTCQGITQS